MLGALLLFWGYVFYLLSLACFTAVKLYVTVLDTLVLQPLGWITGVADHKHNLHSTSAQQQLSTGPQPLNGVSQDLVHRWFNASAALDDLNTPSSCPSSIAGSIHHAPASSHAAAAAAAAMAVVSTANMPTVKAAAAIGAAAVLASHLSRVSEAGSISTPTRLSSCQRVPPLEYDENLQAELESVAPTEFLCPLGRVLMTDPVFTPSGFTYHRPCIVDFLLRTGRDPARDSPLAPEQLCSNINLRDQVATWLQQRGVQT